MSFGVLDFLQIVGALGFFIFGMKIMSEGIQKIAGNKLREILNKMTRNRFSGVFTGFVTTSLIQSSSATTVMVVSFVNAGLLNLRQAIGVIMGANIGTTMTAILVTFLGFSKFSLSDYALPILAFAFPLMFFKSSKAKNWSEFLFGFAFIFMGISLLKDSMPNFSAESLAFLEELNEFGFLSTLIFIGIGTILTILLQSSSASITLTLVLCDQGIINFDMAAAIVLGENIGTTVTANIAALVGNVHAKRAARAHLVFNLFGVFWMLFVFHAFINGINTYFVEPAYGSAFTEITAVKWGLSYFHITFNVLNTFLLVWFVNFIEKVVIRYTPSKSDADNLFSLDYISSGLMSTPELSMIEASKEVQQMAKSLSKINPLTHQLIHANNQKEQQILIRSIREIEGASDKAEEAISNYLTQISSQEVSNETSKKISALLSIIDDLETIGDIYYAISSVYERKIKEKIYFLPDHRSSITQLVALVQVAFDFMLENLSNEENGIDFTPARHAENDINKMRNKLKKMQLKGVETGELNNKSANVFSELYTNLERAGDHLFEIQQALEEVYNKGSKVLI